MPQHDDDIIPHQDETEQIIEQEFHRKRLVLGSDIVLASGFANDEHGNSPDDENDYSVPVLTREGQRIDLAGDLKKAANAEGTIFVFPKSLRPSRSELYVPHPVILRVNYNNHLWGVVFVDDNSPEEFVLKLKTNVASGPGVFDNTVALWLGLAGLSFQLA